ncbi:MAG: transposase [Kiritimatiellaeota bacterium]|nr:transposase [Kiritimatiellota bacterium]
MIMSEDQKLPHRLRRLCVSRTERMRPLFFVTICAHSRCPLLANDAVHRQFLDFCRRAPEKLQVHVGRYVLMPDHIHVFVSCAGSQTLSRWVKALKGFLAKGWREQNLAAPFWQKSFFDHLMRSGESYAGKWSYVCQNPVRAGLVKTAEEWLLAGEIERLTWD